jgi:RAB protein geranylgeranyltransferase component A
MVFNLLFILILSDLTKVPVNDGKQLVKKFLSSLGRYGESAFLCCLFGSSELCQAYCR